VKESTPTFANWYPDSSTGGTKYWDGNRWTGDTRPRRRSFAAAAKKSNEIPLVLMGGLGFSFICVMAFFDDETEAGTALPLLGAGIIVAIVAVSYSVYLIRGQGPTTASIEQRLAADAKLAQGKRRSANMASVAERLVGRSRRQQPAPPMFTQTDTAGAHNSAISSGETTRSLEKLQHLLFSGAITDAEHQVAKDKVLGTQALDDPFAQVAKLAELHRDGVLGDVEFAAAKARVLDF
jgi:hypothetical protein